MAANELIPAYWAAAVLGIAPRVANKLIVIRGIQVHIRIEPRLAQRLLAGKITQKLPAVYRN